ncbi:MAG: ABATE domain-containing protein, partial [Bradyrhizobium sp.]|nr:ABATE domain-containing protein [Bradyrhizobium sp.]
MSRDIARAAAQFFGGRVCLDFANTLDWRTSDDPVELIPDYPAFLAWSARRGTLTEPAAKALRLRASGGEADAVMERVWSLRCEIWRIAEALRERGAVDLNTVNGTLSALPPQPGLVSIERGYGYGLSGIDL